ncbi:MAG: TonB-dependent receptor [Chitinophagales bacterium]|nr:TonB-dependent receptor [Chitinophagales bacterium]
MRNIFILVFIMAFLNAVNSQNIQGHVMTSTEDGDMESLPGANISWLGTAEGTVSDPDGYFSLKKIPKSDILIVSYIGFTTDTIEVGYQTDLHVMLTQSNTLDEVFIKGKQSASKINTSDAVNSIDFSKEEFLKAACCNLSESFETSMVVDAEYKDAITGARTIRLLGLDGVYSQIMTENIQVVRGLSSSYGLTYIPGSWIESIQISKGPGSVINGYEGITGSINTELKKPYETKEEKFFLNLYGSNSGRYEANINYAQNLNEKFSTMLLFSTAQAHTKLDHNEDSFLDVPLTENYLLMNRWNYFGKKHEAQAGIKLVYSDITGGQNTFDSNMPRTIDNGYGVGIDIRRMEAYLKNGFLFTRPNTSIGIILNGSLHEQNSFFGLNDYNANEEYFNANLIGQTYIFNTNHLIKGGGSYILNNVDETYQSVNYTRNESVPGVFAEYSYTYDEKLSVLGGIRTDFHNLYGTFISPRMHAKYTLNSNTTFRLSAGKAYRVANVLAENTSILTSARQFILEENLLPEQAWNYGATVVQNFYIQNRTLTLTVDAYHTDFVNQIIVDVDRDPNNIYVSNLYGNSYSNILQAEANYEVFKNFNLRLAYRYSDVQTTYQEGMLEVPYVYKNRGLINVNYLLEKSRWEFDATMQYYGASRLPDMSANPEASFLEPYSPDYVLVLAQVTKKFKLIDVYIGTENLTNYTQENPVIGYNDPFSNNFDASVVYAPTMARKIYGGIRLTIKEK